MPRVALIICASTRSGSGHLASALWETELAGRPDEYFGAQTRAEYAELWGAWTDERYVARMLEYGTTANGVFSVKLHGDHLRPARDSVRSALGPPASRDPFSTLAPRSQYVWLKRRDKVRQGVSAFRAFRGGGFARRDGSPHPALQRPEFDYEAIRRSVARCIRLEADLAEYFREVDISPMTVVYEDDLERDFASTVRRVLESIDVPVPADLVVRSSLRKQSDAWSERLVERYLAEACPIEAFRPEY